MPAMTTSELRTAYLEFFRERGHAIIPSASLLPENDPTTLFTGSGMQPMLAYLLGEPHPLGKRIADSQKSFRSQDIEEVGDNRHTTFFEMLGNWSLGDYFKKEQIAWMFQFLTQRIGLDPRRIFVTVFRGKDAIPRDDDSVRCWEEQFSTVGIEAHAVDLAEKNGMGEGRIFYYNEKKNWWSRAGEPVKMPLGEPGGPDSEMFFDFGEERKLHEVSPWKDLPCHVNCDCGRFLEIGNNVFMQYIKRADGFEKLTQQNVDFGGGLERIAAALNDDPDVFMIDAFTPMRRWLEEQTGKSYGIDAESTRSFRIIMDHLRAATFLIADGAPPGNRDQGYFTRRLLRRAIWFGEKLGLGIQFSSVIARDHLLPFYATAYPDLLAKREELLSILAMEEQQFRKTLAQGKRELQDYFTKHSAIDGATMFHFFETYGVPRELTMEIAASSHMTIDRPETFDTAKAKHSEESRTASAGKFKGGLSDHSAETTKLHTATHLLNAALRTVLGTHIEQKGSNITAERLRFDFNHPEKMTPEQLQSVERLVNEAIAADLPVVYHVTSVDGAKGEGAIGVFDSRYGAEVKVYVVGDGSFSKEICGGPHVARTGMIGRFTIQKEESSSAGIRRIKATVSGGPATIDSATQA